MVKPIRVRGLWRGGIFLAAVALALLATFAAHADTEAQGTPPGGCPLGAGLRRDTVELQSVQALPVGTRY